MDAVDFMRAAGTVVLCSTCRLLLPRCGFTAGTSQKKAPAAWRRIRLSSSSRTAAEPGRRRR
eukprot:10485957-Lingulodinium_polyedra.AAC.1